MAKKGKRKKKQTEKKTTTTTMAVIIMLLASILLAVLIYTNSGFIGEILSPFLGGIMGYVKYILPIGVFVLAIYIASQGETSWASKIIQLSIMLLCISIVMNVYEIYQGKVQLEGKTFQDIVEKFYQLGAAGEGGGAVSAIVTIPLINLLGKPGTIIVAIGGILVLLVSMFGIDLVNKISEVMEESSEIKERNKSKHYKEDDDEHIIGLKERKETKKEKKLREKLEKEKAASDVEQLQIKLNTEPEKSKLFNIDKENRIFKKDKEENKQAPEFIEDPLFKKQQEQKEDKTKEVLQLEHTISAEDENDKNYEFPPLTLLSQGETKGLKGGKRALTDTASKLQKTLYSFGVSAKVENVSVGPAITRYELKPSEGVRVSKIANLADDIALNLAAKTIRIEAPIPGKQAVGIEVPNEESEMVHIRDILDTDEFKNHKSKLAFALGKDVSGTAVVTDIAKMPHVMIAGATGSGKSVCINTLISSIIYKAKPSEVKLIMIDELADLMMVAKNDVEDAICRLAQKARAAGMHLVIATQRPSVDVITGLIKANVPSRIAFAVSSQVDSRTILDSVGAEKLLGKGDMLFFPSGASKPSRVQGAFVSDDEVEKIVDFVKSNGTANYSEDILESIEKSNKTDKELAQEQADDDETDPFLMDAIQTVVETGQASTSFIQRRFKVGYARAGRIIDQMEERGIISGYQGSKPREVLMTLEKLNELKTSKDSVNV